MSWSSVAEGAGEAGSAASDMGSGASSAASGAGSMGSGFGNGIGGASGAGGSIYGGMANVGGDVGETSTGFSSAIAPSSNIGPTVEAGNLQTYGTATPSMFQKAGDTLSQFEKGQGNNMFQAADKFGNNPQTYGYAYGKLQKLLGGAGGGGASQPNVTTNISYQQPENPYLKRKGRY